MRLPAAGKVQYPFLLAVVEEEIERPDIAHLTCTACFMSCTQRMHQAAMAALLRIESPHLVMWIMRTVCWARLSTEGLLGQ